MITHKLTINIATSPLQYYTVILFCLNIQTERGIQREINTAVESLRAWRLDLCQSSLVGWSNLQLDGALCSKRRWEKDEIVCLNYIYIYIYVESRFVAQTQSIWDLGSMSPIQ